MGMIGNHCGEGVGSGGTLDNVLECPVVLSPKHVEVEICPGFC